MKTAVVTIVTKNYLHFARTLMRSVMKHHPNWDRYVLLVDEVGTEFDPSLEPFKVVTIETLKLPDYKQFLFRYNAFELAMAMKPYMLDWLYQQDVQYDNMIYLDSDIYIYAPATELIDALHEGKLMVLTPHLTSFVEDGKIPGETDILLSGTFNLGCIGVSRHKDTQKFLEWWKRKLEFNCIIDFSRGLFADQKWLDLVIGYFDDVKIIRHEGYNVAYWNLNHRIIEKVGDRYLVNGHDLVFFHYSGFNPLHPSKISKHQNRFDMNDLNEYTRELFRQYSIKVLSAGFDECKDWTYTFGSFYDGKKIKDSMRSAYRKYKSLQNECGADPFAHSKLFKAYERDTLKQRLMNVAKKVKPYVEGIIPVEVQQKIKSFLK